MNRVTEPGHQEDLPVRVAGGQVGDHRRRHEQRQDDQQDADHHQDRPQVEHARLDGRPRSDDGDHR